MSVPGLSTVLGLGWLESCCQQVCFEPQLFSLIAPRKPSVSDTLSIQNSGLEEQAHKGLVVLLASPQYCGWGQGAKTFLPPQLLSPPGQKRTKVTDIIILAYVL